MAETGRLTAPAAPPLAARSRWCASRSSRPCWWRGRRSRRRACCFATSCRRCIAIGRALVELLADRTYYWHLGVTAGEIGIALLIGGLAGLVVGIVLGGNRLLSRAFEPFLYYLGPTPKIIFFPVMIMWFGVGPGSKVAMGALSCFFPVALSVAAGMRQIDPVLIRVGRSFRAAHGRW